MQDVKKNRIVDNNAITAKEFFELWIKDHVDPNLSPSTADKYKLAMNHASAHFGKVKIQKVTPHQIQKWVNVMNDSELSKSSAVTYYNAIKAAFTKAVSWRIISQTPCIDITLPRIKKKAMKTLTSAEVNRLLAETKKHPVHLVFLLAVSCGLRRGEILGLRWRQVDLENQTLSITENYTQSTKGAALSELKNESSYRTVDFDDSLVRALQQQRARQLEVLTSGSVVNLSALSEDNLQDLHVCTWYDLKPLFPGYVTKKFKQTLKKTGLPPMRFHDLRHTHASLLLASGETIVAIQKQLGHARPSITVDIYMHVAKETQVKLSEKMDLILSSGRQMVAEKKDSKA